MKLLSVRTKLALSYAGVLALLLSGLSGLFYRTLASRLERSVNDELNERAAALRGYLKFSGGRPTLVYNPNDQEETYFIRIATRYFQAYDATSGDLLVQSQESELLNLQLSPEEVKHSPKWPQFTDVESRRGRLRFHNYVVANGIRHSYLVRVGTSLAPQEEALRQLRVTLLVLLPAGVLLAGLGGWWMAWKALRPVEELTATAQQISISHLDRRLPLRGSGDEFDRLAETFNQVLARLQEAIEQMQQFTAAISHELRTPLTALRGEAEVTLLQGRSLEDFRRVLASQLEEFDKLTRMVNQLLTLARAEAGEIRLESKPVQLSALVRSLADQMEPVAAAKDVQLTVQVEEGVEVSGDTQWLEHAILNLLDNAIKFTPARGRIELELQRKDEQARLIVRDTGTGIPPDALPHVFDRFYRADPSRSKEVDGAGLGLSLVRWIVTQHQGSVEVESQLGQGSRFTIRLPLASFRAGTPPAEIKRS